MRFNCPTLVDGDIVAYKCAAKTEVNLDWADGEGSTCYPDWEEAKKAAMEELASYMPTKGGMTVCFTSGRNFRKDILSTYKANRADKHRPENLGRLKAWISENYPTYTIEGLEADDVLGILATQSPGSVIISEDKDMLQIPGRVYNPRTDVLSTVTLEEADRWHYMQTLMGDSCDGYTGCPKVGPKNAEKILSEFDDILDRAEWHLQVWAAILDAYDGRGYDSDYATTQARVAKILRVTDFNFDTEKAILWQPPVPRTSPTVMASLPSQPLTQPTASPTPR